VLWGVALAAPLLLVFAALFASADQVFNNVLTNAFAFNINTVVSHTIFIGFWAFLVAGYLRWSMLGRPVQGLTPAPRTVSSIVPLATALGLLNAGPILKMTQATMEKMLDSDFSRYEVLCGVPHNLVVRHALRNALPSIVTIISVLYGYLIGGAVLVEIVFSWGGAGQYAVQGVLNSDIYPVLGFVLFSAIFSLMVYIVVDLIYVLLDPRISN